MTHVVFLLFGRLRVFCAAGVDVLVGRSCVDRLRTARVILVVGQVHNNTAGPGDRKLSRAGTGATPRDIGA